MSWVQITEPLLVALVGILSGQEARRILSHLQKNLQQLWWIRSHTVHLFPVMHVELNFVCLCCFFLLPRLLRCDTRGHSTVTCSTLYGTLDLQTTTTQNASSLGWFSARTRSSSCTLSFWTPACRHVAFKLRSSAYISSASHGVLMVLLFLHYGMVDCSVIRGGYPKHALHKRLSSTTSVLGNAVTRQLQTLLALLWYSHLLLRHVR